jgi:hypothetical protein
MQVAYVEEMVEKIQSMDRDGLVKMLRGVHCGFAIDFTDEFLSSVSIERLRHICLAVSLHVRGPVRP